MTKWNVLFSAVSLLKHGTTRGYCFSLLIKIYEAVIHVCSVHFVFLVCVWLSSCLYLLSAPCGSAAITDTLNLKPRSLRKSLTAFSDCISMGLFCQL